MDEEGHLHSHHKNIKEEAVKHFKILFKEKVAPFTYEQVRVAAMFPILITEGEVEAFLHRYDWGK
jgi:hypothetical protein